MNTATGETADTLITIAADHGYHVTPVMLKKWRDAGLVPRPRQRSRGRGHGTVTLYPEGTAPQLLRILAIRERHGRFRPEQALWQLWWEGFHIEQALIHDLLAKALDKLSAWVKMWQASDADQRLDLVSTLNRLPEPLRMIRKRVGSPGFDIFATTIVQIASGDFSGFDNTDERRAFLEGTGLDRASRDQIGRATPWFLRGRLNDQLCELAAILQPESLRDALAQTVEADNLDTARDELQAFLGFLYTIRLTLESIRGDGAFGLASLPHPNDIDHRIMPSMMLGWLAFRHRPSLNTGYEALMQFAASGAPTAFFIDLIRDAETQELPRRLEPSGSMTHGEEPSTCTTNPTPPSPPPDLDTAFSP